MSKKEIKRSDINKAALNFKNFYEESEEIFDELLKEGSVELAKNLFHQQMREKAFYDFLESKGIWSEASEFISKVIPPVTMALFPENIEALVTIIEDEMSPQESIKVQE